MKSLSLSATFLATVAAFVVSPQAANAAVTVIGNSSARLCYEAARSPTRSSGGIRDCDMAFANDSLTQDDVVATHVNRGILRATGGNIPAAIADYDAALALDPDEPEAWLNKGFATLRTGNAAGSLPFFDAAVAKRTIEPALAHYGRGVAHELAGDLRNAYADYVRARDLKPDWLPPQEELRRFRVEKKADAR